MLDHMLFNAKKWFNVDDSQTQITANGKRWFAIPTKVVIKSGANINQVHGITSQLVSETTFSVVGYFNEYDNVYPYLLHGTYTSKYLDNTETNTATVQVDKEDVKKVIWGGKNLLSHFWHRIRQALSRESEVSLCL